MLSDQGTDWLEAFNKVGDLNANAGLFTGLDCFTVEGGPNLVFLPMISIQKHFTLAWLSLVFLKSISLDLVVFRCTVRLVGRLSHTLLFFSRSLKDFHGRACALLLPDLTGSRGHQTTCAQCAHDSA